MWTPEGRQWEQHPASITILALSLGGAVIPVAQSIQLQSHQGLGWDALIGVAVVGVVVR